MFFDIAHLRLQNQHLLGHDFKTPGEVVRHLGAVQAQDYAMAKWAVGLRMEHATDVSIEDAFNKGDILRTHVLRPTWHFVMPEDIRWMQELTSLRVKVLLGHYNRKLELDDALFKKTNGVITKALRNHNYLTRQELKKLLEKIGIKTDVQRLAHIIMWPELEGIICSGPRKGRQFTYALLEERVPQAKKIDRDEALAKLTLKYFTSHGPAQLKDFSWWSGLTVKDAQKGLDLVKNKLEKETIENKTYYFVNNKPHPSPTSKGEGTAFLLSIYDEYTIAYTDRSALGGERYAEKLLSMGNWLTAVTILEGKIVGTWKRVFKKETVEVNLHVFHTFTKQERLLLEEAANHYANFLKMKVSTVFI